VASYHQTRGRVDADEWTADDEGVVHQARVEQGVIHNDQVAVRCEEHLAEGRHGRRLRLLHPKQDLNQSRSSSSRLTIVIGTANSVARSRVMSS